MLRHCIEAHLNESAYQIVVKQLPDTQAISPIDPQTTTFYGYRPSRSRGPADEDVIVIILKGPKLELASHMLKQYAALPMDELDEAFTILLDYWKGNRALFTTDLRQAVTPLPAQAHVLESRIPIVQVDIRQLEIPRSDLRSSAGRAKFSAWKRVRDGPHRTERDGSCAHFLQQVRSRGSHRLLYAHAERFWSACESDDCQDTLVIHQARGAASDARCRDEGLGPHGRDG